MAYSSRLGQEHFDLLPFINILMCTLGCLLLVALSISCLSLGSAWEEWCAGSNSAASLNKTPVLLVCDGTTLVAELKSDALCAPWPPKAEASAAACPAHGRRGEFVDIIGYFWDHRDTEYPFIAVRPSCFEYLDELTDAITAAGLSVGYEPIGQSKAVRLGEERDCR